LATGAQQQTELRHAVGAPAQSTLRAQLKRLDDAGAVDKQRRNGFPGVLEYELTVAGRDLLFVIDVIERWLETSPSGPLQLDETAAKTALKALAEGWSTTMLRALSANPLSLTELDRLIAPLSYPSLERRLTALRLAGQISARAANGRGTPYELTDWARAGAGPLAAAAFWEGRHMPGGAVRFERIDAETLFLLSTPLLRLREKVSGTCRMAIELPNGNGSRLAGVVIGVRDGRMVSCTSRLQGVVDAWALGSATAWLEALTQAGLDRIEPGGDSRLARLLLDSLHQKLIRQKS
jgi:DNA-binding HxlR family transcriptional regulator